MKCANNWSDELISINNPEVIIWHKSNNEVIATSAAELQRCARASRIRQARKEYLNIVRNASVVC